MTSQDSTFPLERYDSAIRALAECVSVDEAKDIADKAAALAAYARQADDPELEAMARRIRLLAVRRMGEISAGLETRERARTDLLPTGGKQTKSQVLADAGISTSTANRAEKVAAIPQDQFDEMVAALEPPTLKAVIRGGAHVSQNSTEQEWYTPAYIIEAARQCMGGGIDLDPCSSEHAQATVKAARYFTKADDGLMQMWAGRVWMNPPYDKKLIGEFVKVLLLADVEQAIVLVNNATETGWGQALLTEADAICFPSGRVRFESPSGEKGAPLQGQMILGFMVDDEKFREAFGGMGVVL